MAYPRYKSHKEVEAAKIDSVDKGADGSLVIHLEGGFDPVKVSHHDRAGKPHPETGWYLIRYADGYISFSPPDSFEEGYSLIEEAASETETLSGSRGVGKTARAKKEKEAVGSAEPVPA